MGIYSHDQNLVVSSYSSARVQIFARCDIGLINRSPFAASPASLKEKIVVVDKTGKLFC